MTTTISTHLQARLDEFRERLSMSVDRFKAAGDSYVKAIDELGDAAREAFRANFPQVTPSLWRRLEAVGRNEMDSRLLVMSSAGANALRRCPFSVQKVALANGVEVLTANGDVLKVSIDNLTIEQVRQVFAGDHTRDAAAQRAWLETSARKAPKPPATAYRISAGKVTINQPCTMTRVELLRILAEMG